MHNVKVAFVKTQAISMDQDLVKPHSWRYRTAFGLITDTHPYVPTTRQKQHSRHGMRNYAKNAARQSLRALSAQLTQSGKNVA